MTGTTSTSTVGPNEELVDSIRKIVAQVLQRDPAEVESNCRLFDDLGLDSTSALELLMEIEAGIGVEFDVDTFDIEHFATVRSLAGYVQSQMDG